MIYHYPDPVLLRVCAQIEPTSRLCKKIVAALRVDMFAYRRQGIGLSSPQIGLAYRVFVMDNRSLGIGGSSAYINPEITTASKETDVEEEGCLSFPSSVAIAIERHTLIKISAFDLNGQQFRRSLNGLAARCFQHELDHINGITLWHHASDTEKRQIERALLLQESA